MNVKEPASAEKAIWRKDLSDKSKTLVKLLENDNWNDDFLSELCSFPTGAHDDQVDAASAAFDRLLNNTMGIIAFMEAQLKAAGVDPAALRTGLATLTTELRDSASALRTELGDAGPSAEVLAAAMGAALVNGLTSSPTK